jgi:hypothetical protein
MREDRIAPPHSPLVVGSDTATSDEVWPAPQDLYNALGPWRGRKAFIVPIADKSGRPLGNNGDELMMKVFRHILDRFEMRTVEEIRAADVLIVPPNGALLQMYKFPDLLREYTTDNLHAPMIIFPSSAQFLTRDPSFMFRGRLSRTTWILREQYSFAHLRDLWGESLAAVNCELLLDHDVVASHPEFVRGLFEKVSSGCPLVGARKDVEQNSAPTEGGPEAERFGAGVMSALKSTVVRHAAVAIPYGRFYTGLARTARARLQKEAGARLIARLPAGVQARFRVDSVIHRDVSSKHQATFDEYLRTIASAGVVATDRLHIALPATILGKDVWLIEGGYHKARGVVERSLTHAPNLHLVVPARPAE